MKRLFHGGVQRAILALGASAVLAACSNSAVPQNTPGLPSVSAAHSHGMQPAVACPPSGLVVSGNIGTYSVGIGDKCVLYGQDDIPCQVGIEAGYSYSFLVFSGAGHGSLTGDGSMSTYKRTSSGNVVIKLEQQYYNPVENCRAGALSTYGQVTLD